MTEEEKNSQLIDVFKSYEWIILHTNPIYTEIDLSFTIEPVPSCIRKDVDRYKQKEWLLDKNKTPRDILFLQSINLLLSELVKKGIPLYKVDNKEITCVADIERLWQETGLKKDYYPFIATPSYTHEVLQARLTPQRQKILKELEKKVIPASTPQDRANRQAPLQLDSWSVSDNKQEVCWNRETVIKLSNIPYKLFVCLFRKKGKFVKTETLEKCWDRKPDYDKFLVEGMGALKATLKKELTEKGINIQWEIIESKKNDKRKIIAYKLPH